MNKFVTIILIGLFCFSLFSTLLYTQNEARAASTYNVIFSETGLTSMYVWSVTFNGMKSSSNDPGNTLYTITFTNVPPGSYQYTIQPPTTFSAQPPSGSIQVTNKDYAQTINFSPISASISTNPNPATGTVPFTVAFSASVSGETPPYTYLWSFGANLPTSTQANPSYTYTTAGTYTATLTVTDNGKNTANAQTTIIANPTKTLTSLGISATPNPVTQINGLSNSLITVTAYDQNHNPMGSGIPISLSTTSPGVLSQTSLTTGSNGQTQTSSLTLSQIITTSTTVTLEATSGTLQSPTVQVTFNPQPPPSTYSVSFIETGLTVNTQWSATFNGQTLSSTSNTITFNGVSDGSYYWFVYPPTGYTSNSQTSGTINVNGANFNQPLTFVPIFTVTFIENGLPSGREWGVTFNGITSGGTSNSILFAAVQNGNYQYSINSDNSYVASPSSGNSLVSGNNVNVPVMWTQTFSIAWITDTQHLSNYNSALFSHLTNWIATNHDGYNFKMVVHTGDIVDDTVSSPPDSSQSQQWSNANAAMNNLLVNGIPYCFCAGNHDDQWLDGNPSQYPALETSFVQSNDKGFTNGVNWVDQTTDGISQTTDGQSTAVSFTFNNIEFLIIDIQYDASQNVLTWANTLVTSNPGAYVIVGTHAYLSPDGKSYFPQYSDDSNPLDWGKWSTSLQNSVLAHPNVFMTLNGHYGTDGVTINSVASDSNHPARQELMFDRQEIADQVSQDGANAVTILTFDTSGNNAKISVKTFDDNSQSYLSSYQYSITTGLPIQPTTYPVTFSESGLASGTSWSVTFNGQLQSSSSSSIIFSNVPNGNYAFSITPPSGYTTTQTSGTINVNNAATTENIVFSTINSNLIFMFKPASNGLTVEINGGVSSNGNINCNYISWDWGDGSQTRSWFPVSHTYSYSGSYEIIATATYLDGSTASCAARVSVSSGQQSNGYHLIINAGSGGSVSYSSFTSGTITSSTPVTLYVPYLCGAWITAIPNQGYIFSNWTIPATGVSSYGGAVNITSPSLPIALTIDSTIQANFIRNPATLSFTNENVNSWYWTSATTVNTVAVGDVNGDGQKETVTGGTFFDGTRNVAQLIVWNSSSLSAERLITWYWTGNTTINSVAIGDVNGDGKTEIVTGGSYFDGTRNVAQLCVWDGATLVFENVKTWYWTSNTVINSVALGDVNNDGQMEIVTGGYFNDGTRNIAQLVEWNGANLAIDKLNTWYWTSNTVINSVTLGDVNNDGQVEVVTGGYYNDGTRNIAQLVEWNGLNLALDRLVCWYWTSNTAINSVAIGDVNNDGQIEIVTGGYYNDGTRNIAQLVVWAGSNLAVDTLTGWYWTGNTAVNSVAIGDVNGDGKTEIVTGGSYFDGTRNIAQMVVWSGTNLAAVNIKTWYWTNSTTINSIAIGDVNDDFLSETVTGGAFNDGTRMNSQLTVWGMV